VTQPERIRILLIDDDQGDFQMTRAMIDQIDRPGVEYTIDWVATYEEGLDAIRAGDHDVYLVDYFLEDRDGLQLVRVAREEGVREPVIMLTGRGSREVDVEAMKAGASDYLVKGRTGPDQVERSLRYAIERVRAEAALRESEERHRSMFDHLPIGLYRIAPDGTFIDANPALVRILDHPDPETLQERYASTHYVHPDDKERFETLLEQYGVVRGFESSIERADGSEVRVRLTARAHRDADGEIRYYEGAVEDVTEERRAETLRGSAERFDTIFEHSRLAILLTDLEGRILKPNPAFLNAFGYAPGDLSSLFVSELAVADDRTTIEGDVHALSRGREEDLTGERRFVGGDQGELWARVRSTLIRDPGGNPDHIMFLFDDVAEAVV